MEAEKLNQLVSVFRRRARNLRNLAILALIMILFSLGGGIYIFVVAGEIASREANLTLDRLTTSLERFSRDFSDVAPELRALFQVNQDAFRQLESAMASVEPDMKAALQSVAAFKAEDLANADFSGDKELRDAFKAFLDNQGAVWEPQNVLPILENMERASSQWAALSVEAATSVELSREILDGINRQVPETIDRLLSANLSEQGSVSQKDEQLTFIVATLSTRVGALFILIFLVQILVNLYRYNVRLSTYYDARADAFEIYGASADADLADMIRALSPENLDFGKTPSSPAQQAVELAKEVMSHQKRG